MQKIVQIPQKIALFLIFIYQNTLGPILGPRCRFEPSCSHYTYQVIQKYGLIKGSFLGIKRISKCHPLHPGGYDPIP